MAIKLQKNPILTGLIFLGVYLLVKPKKLTGKMKVTTSLGRVLTIWPSELTNLKLGTNERIIKTEWV